MSSNNKIGGELQSPAGETPPPSPQQKQVDDTAYIIQTDNIFPQPTKEDRSISTHILATEVKNRDDFKDFMLAKNKLYADIASNSLKKDSRQFFSFFLIPFAMIVFGLKGSFKNEKGEKVPIHVAIRILLAVSLPCLLPFAVVGVILALSVSVVELPIAKLKKITQDKQHAKNLINYLYGAVLEKTFNTLNLDDANVDEKFWQDLAKTFDEGMNNAKKSAIIPKADKEDKSVVSDTETLDYTTQIKKMLASDFNNFIKNLPDDKVDESFKDNFKKEVFDDNNDLKPEIINLIEDITKNKLKEYVDGLKDI